jgi:hypothetical protein
MAAVKPLSSCETLITERLVSRSVWWCDKYRSQEGWISCSVTGKRVWFLVCPNLLLLSLFQLIRV